MKSDAVDAPTAFRFAWHMLAEPNLVGGTGLPVGAFRGGEVPEFVQTLPGGSDYVLVYELDLAKLARDIEYDVDRSSRVKLFDRIGYLLELESARSGQQKVFVSMDAFTDDVTKIGIPTLESKARFQQTVNALEVFSNVDSLTAGTDIKTGNIEFWPDNYSAANGLGISGASQSVYDFGDDPGAPRDGYGSMQVHNYASGQTVFSVNHWKQGDQADIGIGNSPGDTRDWTFTGNAGSYSKKRLRVYVRPKQ